MNQNSTNHRVHRIIKLKKIDVNNNVQKESIKILNEGLKKDLSTTEELLRQSGYRILDEDFTRKILSEIDDRIIACEESDVDKSLLTQVKHNYYELKDIMVRQALNVSEKKSNQLEYKTKELESKINKKVDSVDEKIANIGYNILSIIISFSLGSSIISGIDKISAIYVPLFIIGTIWLMMTLIVFVNGLFNKDDFNSRQSTVMYVIYSILTLIAIAYTLYFSMKNIEYVPLCEISSAASEQN